MDKVIHVCILKGVPCVKYCESKEKDKCSILNKEKFMGKIEDITKEEFIEQIKRDYSLYSHGVIYKVNTGFRAELTKTLYIKNNEVMTEKYEEADFRVHPTKYIEKGSFIEFRYENDAHCRDEDNDYFRIDPSILAIKCEPFAQIDEKTRFENNLKLKEILEQKLYKETTFKSAV
jgi:hypothetical protein